MKNHEYLQFQILVENETQVCFRISAQKYRENKLTPVGNTFILVTQSEFERILRACEKYNSFMQKYEEVTTSKTENETRKD
jgi:hypothetical protein